MDLESEEDVKMKNSIRKTKIAQIKASRGIERKRTLERGDIWIPPTTYMDLKTSYNRSHKKKETRQMIQEYKEV